MIEKLRSLCIRNNYFTSGSVKQYETMFDMAVNGSSPHDIALVIWICSNDVELKIIEQEVIEILSRNNMYFK